MDVFCEICGKRWDAEDPGVRLVSLVSLVDDRWECVEEVPCSGRRHALETEFGARAQWMMGPGK
jgi:hypothetical protein